MAQLIRPYAKALFELAQQEGDPSIIAQQLRELLNVWQSSTDLQEALTSPQLSAQQVKGLILDVSKKVKLHSMLVNTLLLLAERRRLSLLEQLVLGFEELYREDQGVVVAEIISAEPLAKPYLDQVRQALERIVERKVQLNCKQDPELMAGVVARVGDQVFDGSLASRLDEFEQAFQEEAALSAGK